MPKFDKVKRKRSDSQLASILRKRKNPRPKQLARSQLSGDFLLAQNSINNALNVLALLPHIHLIQRNQPLRQQLSPELLDSLPEELKNYVFEKNIIKDSSGNIYIISESALGKGAFGEVMIAQAIHVASPTQGLDVGAYVAVKKQQISENSPLEKIQAEFGFEKKMPNYHFGSVTHGQDIYSFIKLIRGSELGTWLEKSVFNLEPESTKDVVLKDYEQAFMEFLFSPQYYEVLRQTEKQGLDDLTELEKEIEEFRKKVKDIAVELTQAKEEVVKKTELLEKEGVANKSSEEDNKSSEEDIDNKIKSMEAEKLRPILEKLNNIGAIGAIRDDTDNSVSYTDPETEEILQGDEFLELKAKLNALKAKKISESALTNYSNITLDDCPEYKSLSALEDKFALLKKNLRENVINPALAMADNINTNINPNPYSSVEFHRKHKIEENSVSIHDVANNNQPAIQEKDDPIKFINISTNAISEIRNFDKVLQVSLAATNKLKNLHDENVLHRDLKPANILIDAVTNDVTIIDFGLAQKLDQNKQVICGPAGTPNFWAPEVYQKVNVNADAIVQTTACDLWSLGATFQALVKPLLENIVEENDLKHLTHVVNESGMITITRMHNVRIHNPSSDPFIQAFNSYLEVIDNLKKINPNDRKNLDYVIRELKSASSTLEADKKNAQVLYEVLSSIKSLNGKMPHDIMEAKIAIQMWQKSHPKEPTLKFSDDDIKSLLVGIIEEKANEKEKELQAIAAKKIFTDRALNEYTHNIEIEKKLREEEIPKIEAISVKLKEIEESHRIKRGLESELKKLRKNNPTDPAIENKTNIISNMKKNEDSNYSEIKELQAGLELLGQINPLLSKLQEGLKLSGQINPLSLQILSLQIMNANNYLIKVQKDISGYENRQELSSNTPQLTQTLSEIQNASENKTKPISDETEQAVSPEDKIHETARLASTNKPLEVMDTHQEKPKQTTKYAVENKASKAAQVPEIDNPNPTFTPSAQRIKTPQTPTAINPSIQLAQDRDSLKTNKNTSDITTQIIKKFVEQYSDLNDIANRFKAKGAERSGVNKFLYDNILKNSARDKQVMQLQNSITTLKSNPSIDKLVELSDTIQKLKREVHDGHFLGKSSLRKILMDIENDLASVSNALQKLKLPKL